MPWIQMKSRRETLTPTRIEDPTRRFTHVVTPSKGEKLRAVTWVTMEQVCNGEWSIGGSVMDGNTIHSFMEVEQQI